MPGAPFLFPFAHSGAEMTRTVVIAIGGNSLITDNDHRTVSDQYDAAATTCQHT